MDDEEERQRRRSAWCKAAACFLLLLSPVGAPVMGFGLLFACDIEWMEPMQCFVPEPLLSYFLIFMFIPWGAGGPLVAILWLGVALTVLGCFFRYVLQALLRSW